MWEIIFYIIGAVVFTRLTDYALNGEGAEGIAPAIYIIGAILWPVVFIVSLARFVWAAQHILSGGDINNNTDQLIFDIINKKSEMRR